MKALLAHVLAPWNEILGSQTLAHWIRRMACGGMVLLFLISLVSITIPAKALAGGRDIQSANADFSGDKSPASPWWNPKRYFQTSEEGAASNEKDPKGGSLLRPIEPEQKVESKPVEKKAQIVPPPPPVLGEKEGVVLKTTKGEIYISLFPKEAPQTVENFISLVKQGFYNVPTMKFHRVVPGFVVQTGDPTGSGMGGSGKRIPLEAKNKLTHKFKGVVAMARGPDPNSATSQFYITLAPQTYLDGKYAIFGQVLKGLDVLERIEKDDMVLGVYMADLSTIKMDESLQTNSSALQNFINYFAPSK